MIAAIRIAALRMRLTLEEAISAATINGAHAVQESATTGSLEYGKDADLIALNFPDYRELAYCAGANPVRLTMVKGQVVYREAEVLCPAS